MESKTKSGFTVIQMVEIPMGYVRPNVLKSLTGHEIYADTDSQINENIYPADIFNRILEEGDGFCKNYKIKYTNEDFVQIQELAEECKNYELVRINRV